VGALDRGRLPRGRRALLDLKRLVSRETIMPGRADRTETYELHSGESSVTLELLVSREHVYLVELRGPKESGRLILAWATALAKAFPHLAMKTCGSSQ
jgi:predicted ribonuclease YlaK